MTNMAKQQDAEPPEVQIKKLKEYVAELEAEVQRGHVGLTAGVLYWRGEASDAREQCVDLQADLNTALQDFHAATADPSPEREQPETTEACSVCGGGGIVFAATGEPGKRKCPCCRGTGVVGKRPQEA